MFTTGDASDVMFVVERAVDDALGEVRRQGGAEYVLDEARSIGLATGAALLSYIVAR